jgi:mRNA interferase RelE/StbE
MTTYRIEYAPEIRAELRRVPGNYRQRFRRIIEALAQNPRPQYAIELRDRPNRYRIRVDKWRLVYEVEDDVLLILVLRIGQKTGPEFYEETAK